LHPTSDGVAGRGLVGVTAYLLDVRDDGKRYKLNLRTDHGFDGINYQVRFDLPARAWTTYRLASADFLPTVRKDHLSELKRHQAFRSIRVPSI
jgi:hypothetical protein